MLFQEACNIDALTHNGLSALHVAAMKKKPKVLELLVGYGAQLDLTDDDGDTPLHMVLDRELCLPSDSVPRIHRVIVLLLHTSSPYLWASMGKQQITAVIKICILRVYHVKKMYLHCESCEKPVSYVCVM